MIAVVMIFQTSRVVILGNRDRLLFSRGRRKRPVWWRTWAWWDGRRSWSVEVVAQGGEGGGVLNGVLDSWGRHFD